MVQDTSVDRDMAQLGHEQGTGCRQRHGIDMHVDRDTDVTDVGRYTEVDMNTT